MLAAAESVQRIRAARRGECQSSPSEVLVPVIVI